MAGKRDDREMTYLAGAMDMVPDSGLEWRAAITPKLEALGIAVQDPIIMTNELLKVTSAKEARWALRRLAEESEEKYYKTVDLIEKQDLDAVLRSKFIITFWGWQIPTYGTVVENDTAARNKIPIYCVCFAPAYVLPNWFRKDIHRSGGQKFDDFDGLLRFLAVRKEIIRQYLDKAPEN